MRDVPTIEEMIADLKERGWKKHRKNPTVWQAPDGRIYRGPYRAWTIATGNTEMD